MTLAALVIFLLTLATIIVYPITETTPTWVEPLQANVYGLTARFAPYVLVGLLGATVAIAELVSTFQTYPREALRARWAWIRIGVNVVATIIALVVVRVTVTEMIPSLQILRTTYGADQVQRVWGRGLECGTGLPKVWNPRSRRSSETNRPNHHSESIKHDGGNVERRDKDGRASRRNREERWNCRH